MANLKSAIKRVNTNNTKRELNRSFKSEMRSQIKHVESLVAANDAENAQKELNLAIKKIDKSIQKGIIHRNNGNRQKARIAKKVQAIAN